MNHYIITAYPWLRPADGGANVPQNHCLLKSIADLDTRLAQPQMQPKLLFASRMIAPVIVAFALGNVAHAQGTMDFSGATTLMGTFKTFAVYAGPSSALAALSSPGSA